ncbi:shikimate kinase [Ottowia cancrivicina]
MMERVILVGLPGSGKSTIGRQLARRRELPFFDSDQVIESRLGETIRAFFAREGEKTFRDFEERVIDELTMQGSCVLATGGGAVLRSENRQRMRERGVVVYLRASPEQLMRRLRNDTKRPLLQVADPMARLQDLYEEREPLYKEVADFTFDACGSSPALLVSRVMMQLDLTCKSLPGSETG